MSSLRLSGRERRASRCLDANFCLFLRCQSRSESTRAKANISYWLNGMTGWANVDTAVEAMRRGAVDYLPKPFTPAQIRHVVEQVGERRAMRRRVVELESTLAVEVPELDLSLT